MSDSILSSLADELDVPPEQAKKLLIAMLREVRKRARREGVRLPEFGTFRESHGRITFEPSPSLARAVNHRFEGLESEDLQTAPDTEEEQDEDDGGPSTITLGYQDSDWSPLDEESAEGDEDEEEPDTEEFELPSAAETAESESSDEPDDRETSDTEELYPFVEDVPDGDEEAAQAEATKSEQTGPADEERDSLSNIWSSEETEPDDETSSLADEDIGTPDPEPVSGPESSPKPDPASSVAADASPSEAKRDPAGQEPRAEPGAAASDDAGSTGIRLLAGLLVVLLLGAAGWYVLGQRGAVQPPRKTIAQLQAQVQPRLESLSPENIPLVGQTSEESSPTADAGDEVSSSSETESNDTGPSEDSSDPSTTSETETTPSESTEPASSTTQTGSSQAITPAEGGWTIVVGSRTERAAAQSLAERYRAVFGDQNLPVDVIPGTVDNTTRYRVCVGQFDSRSDAQNFLDTADQQLPQGAWPLNL